MYGGFGNDRLYASTGDDLVIGDFGNDTLAGGQGNDTLQSGAGEDTFIYARGHGRALITDLYSNTHHDELNLSLFNFATIRQAMSYADHIDGNTVFNFGNGDVLTIKGILPDDADWLVI